mmetsp:Transcript_16932/g.45564  ORF Transcript_16932/g.45564 Transcript_16932/m.45564 type:complete len:203 (+) Transcript_16932:1006-1614(+)
MGAHTSPRGPIMARTAVVATLSATHQTKRSPGMMDIRIRTLARSRSRMGKGQHEQEEQPLRQEEQRCRHPQFPLGSGGGGASISLAGMATERRAVAWSPTPCAFARALLLALHTRSITFPVTPAAGPSAHDVRLPTDARPALAKPPSCAAPEGVSRGSGIWRRTTHRSRRTDTSRSFFSFPCSPADPQSSPCGSFPLDMATL